MPNEIMKLNDILASLDEPMEKQASDDSEGGETTSGKEELMKLLKDKNPAQMGKEEKAKKENTNDGDSDDDDSDTKTAAPLNNLEKIAHSVAAAEEDALIKEANLYGAAVCDGFMSRMSLYEDASEDLGYTKTAEEEDIYVDDEGNEYTESQVKYAMAQQEAMENTDIEPEAVEMAEGLIKEAAYEGYDMSGEEALEKVAEVAYVEGYENIMEKAAEVAFEDGYEETMEKAAEVAFEDGHDTVMEKAAEVAYDDGFDSVMDKVAEELMETGGEEAVEALEKAAFETGYDDAMEKVAASAFEQGYADMENIFEQVA